MWDADTTLEITDNGLHIYRNSHTGGAPFTQKFERNFLAPGVYTFSVLSTNGVERLNYYIQGIGDIFSDFDTNKELATHTFIVPETVKDKDHWVSFFGKYGSIVRAAKLEPGPIQTLAHKEGDTWVLNDPPPDYGFELVKCQRYQLNLSSRSVITSGAELILGYGVTWQTTNDISIIVPLSVTLRATPTATLSGPFRLANGVSDFMVTPLNTSINDINSSAISIKVKLSDTNIAKGVYYAYGADLFLDANL